MIRSGFGAQENKICHCFHFFPLYLSWSNGIRCHDLSFLNIEIQVSIFTFLFHPHQEVLWFLFTFCHLSGIIFLLAILILACDSFSQAFHMMYSACKLNKQGDNIQPCHSPFPVLRQSVVLCLVLTDASWPAYSFLRRQVRWFRYSHFFKIFHSLLWSIWSKALA